jgi:hypothetical protein
MAVRRRQQRVLVSVPIPLSSAVFVFFPVSLSVLLTIAFSLLPLGFGSVWLVARAVVDDIDIAVFRGRHVGPCQGEAPALKTGECGCDNRNQL